MGFDGQGSVDRYNQAFNVLKEISLPDAITSAGTPQNRACNWIANSDERRIDIPANATVEDSYVFVQRYVLALLYYSLAGPTWPLQTRFLSSEDECFWNMGMRADEDFTTFGTECDVGEVTRGVISK